MRDYLRYRILEHGVHEFVFLTKKRETVDFFFATIGQLFEAAPKNQVIRYVIDWSTVGTPPMNYMFLKTKEWGLKHPNVAPGRGVVIFSQRGFIPIGNALASIVMQTWGDKIQLHFEHANNRDEALVWLLDDIAKSQNA